MKTEQLIYKAALVLDLRGDTVKAEQCLRAALEQAESEGSTTVAVRAAVFLGDLLCEQGRPGEGRRFLRRALEMGVGVERDLVSEELERARAILAE